MNRKISKSILFFFFCAILFLACSKSDSSTQDDSLTQSSINSNPLNESYIAAVVPPTPTRKAKQYTVTDPETGKVELYFDCREAGTTCDVGEDPPPSNGRSASLVSEIRNTAIARSSSLDSEKISIFLAKNQMQLEDIFPRLFASEVQAGVQSGLLRYVANESHVSVVENSSLQTPVYVYLRSELPLLMEDYPEDTTKTKVAKVNTETGVVECKEAGRNCVTSFARTGNLRKGDYIGFLDRKFKRENLGEQVLSNNYRIYETSNYIQVVPVNEVGEAFYVLK
jgi:hypothetical protein